MSRAEEIIERIEAAGGSLNLHDRRIRCRIPEDESHLLGELRRCRTEVINALLQRQGVPPMPPEVRLLAWHLKSPPIAIETCSVVTEPSLFVKSSLEQLNNALQDPKRWVGWSVPQLIDRLGQVGVRVELERANDVKSQPWREDDDIREP